MEVATRVSCSRLLMHEMRSAAVVIRVCHPLLWYMPSHHLPNELDVFHTQVKICRGLFWNHGLGLGLAVDLPLVLVEWTAVVQPRYERSGQSILSIFSPCL
jgi:hypothetical protein